MKIAIIGTSNTAEPRLLAIALRATHEVLTTWLDPDRNAADAQVIKSRYGDGVFRRLTEKVTVIRLGAVK